MQAYERLEQEWAEANDLDPAGMVACASGTAALHLALEALELPARGKVLVPEFCMIACARAVTLADLTPRFVDCGEDLLADYAGQGEFGPVYDSLMVVHVYGRAVNVGKALDQVDTTTNVEDLAEAHGVRPHQNSDAACWSFYKNKIVAGEEGGAVWFHDRGQAKFARQLRSLGDTEAHDFLHVPRGHNYRMSNAHAELALASLKNFHANTILRRQVEAWYEDLVPAEWRMPPRRAPWVYDVRLRGVDTAKVVKELNWRHVAARLAFKSMSEQSEYRRYVAKANEEAEGYKELVAYRMSREVIYLPIQPEMVEVNVRCNVERLKQAIDTALSPV